MSAWLFKRDPQHRGPSVNQARAQQIRRAQERLDAAVAGGCDAKTLSLCRSRLKRSKAPINIAEGQP